EVDERDQVVAEPDAECVQPIQRIRRHAGARHQQQDQAGDERNGEEAHRQPQQRTEASRQRPPQQGFAHALMLQCGNAVAARMMCSKRWDAPSHRMRTKAWLTTTFIYPAGLPATCSNSVMPATSRPIVFEPSSIQ